ncbi:MAG: amino acid ABC transporter permease, partial [Sciscionella sp.]
ELFSIARDSSINNANLSPLVAAGLIYLAITVPMTYVVNAWEKRLREGRPTAKPKNPALTQEAVA